ncbi:Hypothetical predicted protein [Scomber scombrus]|uniref:Uncharacterized protein n=1 Tax=Scomber scombrus TaxID=13677 RepID=A0AAV1NPT3_SCOSC
MRVRCRVKGEYSVMSSWGAPRSRLSAAGDEISRLGSCVAVPVPSEEWVWMFSPGITVFLERFTYGVAVILIVRGPAAPTGRMAFLSLSLGNHGSARDFDGWHGMGCTHAEWLLYVNEITMRDRCLCVFPVLRLRK